jgi:electron transfer flavoprotein alpha subunit
MGAYRNVVIFGEIENNRLSPMTLELIGLGARLAENLTGRVCLTWLGKDVARPIEEAFGFGADGVFAACDPLLETYVPDAYLQAMEQIVPKMEPAVILFGQTDKGIDLAPRLAFRMKTAVALDCVDLSTSAHEGCMEYTKPVFGGKAHAFFSTAALPLVASVRQGSFAPAEYDGSRAGEVISLALSLEPTRIRARFVRRIEDQGLSLASVLTSAAVVVSGGRGLKSRDGVDLLKETAALLGAAVGGSRPAVDKGWLPSHLQIGLTGKRINPQVYMAVGISGSLQHMAGCMKSKMIVAVNSDESAPIFKMAHIGVVGDYKEVLEGFNEEMRRQLSGGPHQEAVNGRNGTGEHCRKQ